MDSRLTIPTWFISGIYRQISIRKNRSTILAVVGFASGGMKHHGLGIPVVGSGALGGASRWSQSRLR